jgi:hypothetical protein
LGVVGVAALFAACGGDKTDEGTNVNPPPTNTTLSVTGRGSLLGRFTAELWVNGNVAYTTTWGNRNGTGLGNVLYVWDVAGATPQLIDSISVVGATTLGDVQASDDGKILVVAQEPTPGSIVIFDLANPRKPQQIARFTSQTNPGGVHTAEVSRVNGTLYAFLSVPPTNATVIVDLTNPREPREVFAGRNTSYTHDVFVRDGILFLGGWNEGLRIWDIGGLNRGGSITNPVPVSVLRTAGYTASAPSNAHNIFWFQDKQNGSKKYVFVGEEGPAAIGSTSTGDIHVVDVTNMASPREVAFYHLPFAGTHNFSVDEQRGVLYAAFYNGGVRALDIRGDLSTCSADQKGTLDRCDLLKMGREIAAGLQEPGSPPVYVWGVQVVGDNVYASDMLNGLWKMRAIIR